MRELPEDTRLKARFLLPDIYRLQTGGNIYNREILRRLPLKEEFFRPDATPPLAELQIVDSLLLREPGLPAWLAAGKCNLLLVHYLNLLQPEKASPADLEREKALLQRFGLFITTSRYSADMLRRTCVSSRRIRVIRPGLAEIFRRPLSAVEPEGPTRLLTVSSLLPGKGLIEALEALEKMADLNWCWRLVGENVLNPDFSRRFRERLRQSPVGERISLAGALPPERMVAEYDRSHLLLLPSRFESYSMAAAEGCARGLPVLAFAVGGLPESAGPAGRKRLISPGDEAGFRHRLRQWIRRPPPRNTANPADYRSWEDAAGEFATVLKELQPVGALPEGDGCAR